MKYFQVLMVLLLLICSCQKSFDTMAPTAETQEDAVFSEKSLRSDMVPEPAHETIVERKIIKTGWMRIQVKNYSEDLIQIKTLVGKHEGYISGENESSTEYSLNNTLSIRIPSVRFDSLVQDIAKMAFKVDNKNITLSDVTEEFIDIEARLKTKKEVEQRYLEILKKASTVQDILQVEGQMRLIREEIESTEGRLKYLQNQVSLSTLNLEIHQDLSAKPGFKFFSKLGIALEGGWKGLLHLVIGIVYIWPVLLLVTVLIIWIIRRRKKSLKKTA